MEQIDYYDERPKLYAPTWVDLRFAPNPVDFLLERITGNNVISMKIDRNEVKRHVIAYKAQLNDVKFYFSYDSIHFESETLERTRELASIFLSAGNYVYGKILKFLLPEKAWVYIYQLTIDEIYGDNNVIVYTTDDPSRPYTLSCLFDINVSDTVEKKKISNRAMEIYKEHEKDSNKPTHMSVQEWIESVNEPIPTFVPFEIPERIPSKPKISPEEALGKA